MMHKLQFIAAHKLIIVGMISLFATLATIPVAADQRPGDCTGICDLAWSPADAHLIGAVDASGLWLYDTDTAGSDPLFFPQPFSTSLSFDPHGRSVAVLSCPNFTNSLDPCHGVLSLFDLQAKSWKQLGAYDYPISNVKFSPNGKYLAFEKGYSTGIQLIDLATNETFSIVDRGIPYRTGLIIDYVFDPDSRYLAISNGNIAYELTDFLGISLWRLSDQTMIARTWGTILAANLAFTKPDEITFVQYDTQVIVWKYQAGVISPERQITKALPDDLNGLSFSYDSTTLLASLLNGRYPADRSVAAWDIQSGAQIFAYQPPENSFMDLIALDPTDKRIAYSSTVDAQKIVSVWDRTTDTTRQIRMVR